MFAYLDQERTISAMSEILPQVVYSPNGVLSVRTEIRDAYSEETLEHLLERPGTYLDNTGTLQVEVKQAVGSDFGHTRNGAIRDFLDEVGKLLPVYPEDAVDRVVHPLWLSARGVEAAVYTHFQRWLNSQSHLNERVAKETLLAMATPFGKEREQDVNRKFDLYQQSASTDLFEVTIYDSHFGVNTREETDNSYIEKYGRIVWKRLNLSTIGNCACLGVGGEERDRVNVSQNRLKPWLYEMIPHNIDSSHQSLSLLLGIGSLAYHASLYSGQEDILEQVDWAEPRIYPKTL